MNPAPQRLKLSRIQGMSLLRFETLWLEQDHLIVCLSYGIFLPFMEEYRRFFFRDIQGIQISTNQHRHVISVILGLLTVLGLGFALLTTWIDKSLLPFALFLLVTALGLFVILLIHLFKGPTCSVSLKTAVQTIPLRSVRRLPEAALFLSRIKPLIEQAQQELPALVLEELPAAAAVAEERRVAAGQEKPLEPPSLSSSKTPLLWHWLTAGLLLCYGILSLADYFLPQLWITLVSVPVMFAVLLCPIVAVIRQRQMKKATGLALVSWLGLAFPIFVLICGYASMFNLQFKHPELGGNQWEMLKFYAQLSPGQSGLDTVITTLNVIFSLSLGLLYLAATWRESRRLLTFASLKTA